MLQGASATMAAATSFAFVADVSTGGKTVHVAGEFQAPHTVHEILTVPGQAPVELVTVGATTYSRNPTTHAWAKANASSASVSTTASPAAPSSQTTVAATSATAGDPRAAFSVLPSASRLTLRGAVVGFVLSGSAARSLIASATTVTGDATVEGNRLVSLSYRGNDSGHTSVLLNYSELNSAPPVTVPTV